VVNSTSAGGDYLPPHIGAAVTISGIELAEKIKKGQFKTGKFGNRKSTMSEIDYVGTLKCGADCSTPLDASRTKA
jgi:hypothetical protein